MNRIPVRVILVVLLAAALSPTVAHAGAPASGPSNPDAREHYTRGIALFNAGDFAKASGEFEAGYAVDPSYADFLFLLGQVDRLAGDCPKAIHAYRSFLLTNPSPEKRAETSDRIAKCATVQPATGPTAAGSTSALQLASPPAPPDTAKASTERMLG